MRSHDVEDDDDDGYMGPDYEHPMTQEELRREHEETSAREERLSEMRETAQQPDGTKMAAHVLPDKTVLVQKPPESPVALHDNVVSFDNRGRPIPKGNPAKLYENIPGVNVPKNFPGFLPEFNSDDRKLYRAIYKEDKRRTHLTTMEEFRRRKPSA